MISYALYEYCEKKNKWIYEGIFQAESKEEILSNINYLTSYDKREFRAKLKNKTYIYASSIIISNEDDVFVPF